MTGTGPAESTHLRILAKLDVRRLLGLVRNPTLAVFVLATLPAAVLVSALWVLGGVGSPAIDGAAGGATLGMFVSGTVAFIAYGLLFGGADDGLLRLLGVDPRALYVERSARLAGVGVAAALALTIPYLAAGTSALRPLLIGVSVALVTSGAASVTFAAAAGATVGGSRSAVLTMGVRKWDPELAKAAPLIYAPLVPFLVGASYGALAGTPATGPVLALGIPIIIAGAAFFFGARLFAESAPRFLAQANEMAYAPPPAGEGEEFRLGRGLTALLPRRAAAIWVRDAAVVNRRFAWASRITWPVALASIVVLARWGEAPVSRVWVLAAVGLALLVQGAAIVGLGGLERRGPRWIDRSAGASTVERFLGRWAVGWGLSLWLLIPVALAWAWWSGASGAWFAPLLGALSASISVSISLLSAARR